MINGVPTRASRHESQLFTVAKQQAEKKKAEAVVRGKAHAKSHDVFCCDYDGCKLVAIRDWGGNDVHEDRAGMKRRFCGPEHYTAQCDPIAKRFCAEAKHGCTGFAPHGGQSGTRCRACSAARKRANTG